MVEREHAPVQLSRETHQNSPSRNDNYLRCSKGPSGGLGSSLSRAFYRGSMVSTRKETAYKRIGNDSGRTGHQNLHQREKREVYTFEGGNHHNPFIYNENGGTKNQALIQIAKRIWEYLLLKQITLTVEYIPTKLNKEADYQSRNTWDSSEWKLNPTVFNKICQILGKPQIDLFSSRLSHQLPRYMSRQSEPPSEARNALQQNWNHMFPYAFPPFNLIRQTLKKVMKHGIDMLLIAPLWVAQPWYPQLLAMAVKNPILRPQQLNLLTNPGGMTHPLLQNMTLKLTAWLISGNSYKVQAFQSRLPILSLTQEQQAQEAITMQTGKSSLADVVNNRLIHLSVL